jgi:hypothetical protein
MKATEVHGLTVFKSDTKQAFLNGEIGDENIYIRAPDSRLIGGHSEFRRGMLYFWSRVCTGHARQLGNGILVYGYPHGWRIMVMKQ